jgi:putative transposase
MGTLPVTGLLHISSEADTHLRVLGGETRPMARRARGDIFEGSYHVTMRSAGPIAMFVDDVDRTDFCNRLARTIRARDWSCRAFCLMPTHYHLMVDLGENALQPGMHEINGQYAQQFNRRHGRSGHLRGDRYHAVPIETDAHMQSAYRYVFRNPVEAGLCARPQDWLWSSYRGAIGLEPRFAFVDDQLLYGCFGGEPEKAIREIRAYVEIP